jgi:hypothetical protein
LLLLLGTAVQYLAWRFDLEWLRHPSPVFPAIFPWTIVLFFATSLILVFLVLAVRTGAEGVRRPSALDVSTFRRSALNVQRSTFAVLGLPFAVRPKEASFARR